MLNRSLKHALFLTVAIPALSCLISPAYADQVVHDGETLAAIALADHDTGIINVGGTLGGVQADTRSYINIINHGTVTDLLTTITHQVFILNTGLIDGRINIYGATNLELINDGTILGMIAVGGSQNYVFTNNNYMGGPLLLENGAHGTFNNSGTLANYITAYNTNDITINNTGIINGYIDANAAQNFTLNNGTNGVIANNLLLVGSNHATVTNNGTINGILDASNSTDFKLILQGGPSIQLDLTGATNGIVQYNVPHSFASEGGGYATGGATINLPTILGGTENVNYTFSRMDIFNTGTLPAGTVLVTSGGQTLAITPDTFSSANQVVMNTASQVSTLVTQRQQYALLGNNLGIATGTQYAAETSSISDVEPAAGWAVSEQKIGWAEAFGSYRETPKDGDTAFSRTQSGGVLTGVDMPTSSNGYHSGLYVGGFGGQQTLGKTKFRTIENRGALIGGYIGKQFDGFYASMDTSIGYTDNKSDRRVGSATASADYGSYYISPSFTIMRPITGDKITWVPSLSLRYTGQYTGDYQENGSTANQNVDSTTSQSVSARVQMEAHLAPQALSHGVLTSIIRTGIEGEKRVGNQDVNLSVLGSNVTVNPSGGDNTLNGIVGLNLSYDLRDGPDIYIDGESSLGLNKSGLHDNIGGTLRAGLRWQF